jgi:hypothetical protein
VVWEDALRVVVGHLGQLVTDCLRRVGAAGHSSLHVHFVFPDRDLPSRKSSGAALLRLDSFWLRHLFLGVQVFVFRHELALLAQLLVVYRLLVELLLEELGVVLHLHVVGRDDRCGPSVALLGVARTAIVLLEVEVP